MIKEIEIRYDEWLPMICKELKIRPEDVTFAYVGSIMGKNKMTIRYIE